MEFYGSLMSGHSTKLKIYSQQTTPAFGHAPKKTTSPCGYSSLKKGGELGVFRGSIKLRKSVELTCIYNRFLSTIILLPQPRIGWPLPVHQRLYPSTF